MLTIWAVSVSDIYRKPVRIRAASKEDLGITVVGVTKRA
jgi:hypothetical protein